MELLTKIINIQFVICAICLILTIPEFCIANFIERKFGNYNKAIVVLIGSQLVLIVISMLIHSYLNIRNG